MTTEQLARAVLQANRYGAQLADLRRHGNIADAREVGWSATVFLQQFDGAERLELATVIQHWHD